MPDISALAQDAPWAFRLDSDDSAAIGPLRLVDGVAICESNDGIIWIRGQGFSEPLGLALRKLPGQLFTILDDGKLRAPGRRIPRGALPQGPWTPVHEWLELSPQPAALPGRVAAAVELRWQRSDQVGEPRVVLTSAEIWKNWASNASMVRLKPLRFAVSEDRRAIIWGNPLPPIPGARLMESSGIAWPCGLKPDPPIDAAVLRQLLQLKQDELVIFDGGTTCERIACDSFVAATRSAVRLSLPELKLVP